MTNRSDLRSAGLQDIPVSSLREQFQDVRARSTALCDAEQGFRDSDGALVFHFFPPGYAANPSLDWAGWHDFRDRLELAALRYFDPEHLQAGYVNELHSFYLIVAPRPLVPDLTSLIEAFFAALEAGSQTAPESSR